MPQFLPFVSIVAFAAFWPALTIGKLWFRNRQSKAWMQAQFTPDEVKQIDVQIEQADSIPELTPEEEEECWLKFFPPRRSTAPNNMIPTREPDKANVVDLFSRVD